MKILQPVFILFLSVLATNLHAEDFEFAMKYERNGVNYLATIDVGLWEKHKGGDKLRELPNPNLALVYSTGFFSTGVYPTQEGDVFALDKELCPQCYRNLYVYRDNKLFKDMGGDGGIYHCETLDVSSCYKMRDLTVNEINLSSGHTQTSYVGGSRALLNVIFNTYPRKYLDSNSPTPTWGTTLISKSTAEQILKNAQDARDAERKRTTAAEEARIKAAQEKIKAEAAARAAASIEWHNRMSDASKLIEESSIGTTLNCNTPENMGVRRGVAIELFPLRCETPWPDSPSSNGLPVTYNLKRFLQSGWTLAKHSIIANENSGMYLYATLKRTHKLKQ